MKPENLQPVVIEDIQDLVTNIEQQDLSQNFALELNGFRNTKGQTVGQRDYGSRHLYALPPLRPNTVYRINNISYAGTTATLAMTDALPVSVRSQTVQMWIDENTTSGLYSIYNGVWSGTVNSGGTSVTVTMTNGQGTINGGIVCLAPITIVNGTAIYDSVRQRTVDVVVGTDSSGNYRIYVYDQDPITNLYRWIDLSDFYQTTISAISVGGNNVDKVLLGTVTYGGSTFTLPNSGDLSSWVGWYVYNQTKQSIGLIIMGWDGVNYNCVISHSYTATDWAVSDVLVISPSRDIALLGRPILTSAPTSFLPMDAQRKVQILSGGRVIRVQYRDAQVFGAGVIDTNWAHVPTGLTASASGSGSFTVATTLYYRVIAVTPSGNSFPCVSATVAPFSSKAQVDVAWTAVSGATSYIIQRVTQSGGGLTPNDANSFFPDIFTSNTNSYTDTTAPTLASGNTCAPQYNAYQSHLAAKPVPLTLVSSTVPQPAGWFLEYSTIAPQFLDSGLLDFVNVGGDTALGGCIRLYAYDMTGKALWIGGNQPSPWMQLNISSFYFSPATASTTPYANIVKFYATLIYNGYEESDPILVGTYIIDNSPNFNTVKGNAAFGRIEIGLFVSRCLIDPTISGINIYAAGQYYPSDTSATNFRPASSQFKLLFGLNLRQPASAYNQQTVVLSDNQDGSPAVVSDVTWSMFFPPVIKKSELNVPSVSSVVDNYDVWGFYCRIDGGQVLNPGTDDIGSELHRAPDMSISTPYQSGIFAGFNFYSRNEVLPRYIARASRSQVSLVAVDADDRTIRFCGVDGSGNVNDEIFPNLVEDLQGSKLICYLLSRGVIQGLGWLNGKLITFKVSEREEIDPTATTQDILPIDCISPRSILNTEFGLVWAGRYGLYLLSSDGGPVQKINRKWSNIYDGTTLSPSGNPYIQDASQIISGYNKMYKEIVFAAMIWNDNIQTPGYQATLMRYDVLGDRWAFRALSLTGTSAAVPVPTTQTGGGYMSKTISMLATPSYPIDAYAGNSALTLSSLISSLSISSS